MGIGNQFGGFEGDQVANVNGGVGKIEFFFSGGCLQGLLEVIRKNGV